MSVSKLIDKQIAEINAVQKRFDETLTARTYESRVGAVSDDHESRIKERIERLEKQKVASVARFDAAIEAEKKALKAVQARRPDLKPKSPPTTAKKTPSKTTKSRATTARSKKS
jgi:hypothetical protein